MAILSDLLTSSPAVVREKHVQQIISFAGEGKLRDGSATSTEFRAFLSQLPASLLAKYADECLSSRFEDAGLALQDVVNEVGRRLGFEVTNGRYKGVVQQIGFDGIWKSAEGKEIVVEVKTTDAYRIDLDRIAVYRRGLIVGKTISEANSSMLIIVGRQDTGDLEAQIRGSRHAWDVRLISIDSLLRLMSIREELEDPAILAKIVRVLLPQEFTRVDGIVDLVFSTATDVKGPLALEEEEDESEELERPERSRKFTPVSFHQGCIARIQAQLGISLIRRSRVLYTTADGKTAVVCAISKAHESSTGEFYWFAFHPHQSDALQAAENAYVGFGCGSPERLLLIPFVEFRQWLGGMNMTRAEDREYWHVHIFADPSGLTLRPRGGEARIPLERYLVRTPDASAVRA